MVVVLIVFGCLALCARAHTSASRHNYIPTHASQANPKILLTHEVIHKSSNSSLGKPVESYYGRIGIGTPAKLFKIAFDTSTSETWVPKYSANPPASNLRLSHGYDCRSSSTGNCKCTNELSMRFRNTDLLIFIHSDKFTIINDQYRSDSPISGFRFSQNFGVATGASNDIYLSRPEDGYVGLAPTDESASGIESIMINMVRNKVIDSRVVAFWLDSNRSKSLAGELMFGGVDKTKFTGKLRYHEINSPNKWQLGVSYVQLNGNIVSCRNGCNAMLDTTSSWFTGPKADVEAILEQLDVKPNNSGMNLIECGLIKDLPSIEIIINKALYSVKPQQYTMSTKLKGKTYCYVIIRPSVTEDWILGANFIRSFYTVLDYEEGRIGFAKRR